MALLVTVVSHARIALPQGISILDDRELFRSVAKRLSVRLASCPEGSPSLHRSHFLSKINDGSIYISWSFIDHHRISCSQELGILNAKAELEAALKAFAQASKRVRRQPQPKVALTEQDIRRSSRARPQVVAPSKSEAKEIANVQQPLSDAA